jgi:hypothetical protein
MQVNSTNSVADAAVEEFKWSSRKDTLQALDSLRADQCLIVDFGAVIYKLLEMLRPWAWVSRSKDSVLTRDWFHVWAVTIFFPWTWIVWRRRARQMAEVWTNQDLANILRRREPSRNLLSSQGFGPIVRPVLKHMGIPFHKIDTCRLLFGLFRSFN